MKVARDFEKKVMIFAIAAKGDFSRQMSDVGFSTESDEPNVLITSDDGSKYKMTEKFRYEILITTVSSLLLVLVLLQGFYSSAYSVFCLIFFFFCLPLKPTWPFLPDK